MVPERILRRTVGAEAFVLLVVVRPDGFPFPLAVAFKKTEKNALRCK